MNWIDTIRKDFSHIIKPNKAFTDCPECFKKARVMNATTMKNYGRPFLSCPNCSLFKWLDIPKCDFCGEETYEAYVRGGKNKGRKYRTCPNRCPHSFKWLDSKVKRKDA